MSHSIDSARLTLILNDLRLPAIKQDWARFAERADKESWPAARFLTMLAEHEIAEKDRSRAYLLTKGSVQSVTAITEDGFELLVSRSAKPAAKALRKWIVGEVLPSIPKASAPNVAVGQGEFF